MNTAAIVAVSACGVAILFVIGRIRKARKPAPNGTVPGTCAWARALYFSGIISMEELHNFTVHHGTCPTCLIEDTNDSDS